MRQWLEGHGGILTFVAIFGIWFGSIGFVAYQDLMAPYVVRVLPVDGANQEVRVYQERYGIRIVTIHRDGGSRMVAGYFLLKEENGLTMRGQLVVGRFVPPHIVWWPAPESADLYRQLAPQFEPRIRGGKEGGHVWGNSHHGIGSS